MLNADKFEITSALLKELAEADVGQTLSIIMRIRSEAISECKYSIVDALQREVSLCRGAEPADLEEKTSKNKFDGLTKEEWVTFYICKVAREISERMIGSAREWPKPMGSRGHSYPVTIVKENADFLLKELRRIEGGK